LAALAVIIMSLGTVIPATTFAAPVLCIELCRIIVSICGHRIAWAWYGAVTILALLLAPDKEAAAVFLALGYYPIVKPALDRTKASWFWKILLFNGTIIPLYWVLLNVVGLDQLQEDFSGGGIATTMVLLLLGNVTFVLLDWMLTRRAGRKLKWMKAL